MANYHKLVNAENGYRVGAAGSERQFVGTKGQIYIPDRNKAGTVQMTAVASTVTGTATTGTTGTVKATVKTTLTRPFSFLTVKIKGKQNATKKMTMTVNCGGVKVGTKKATTKTTTTTLTKTNPWTGSPVLSLKQKGTSVKTVTGSIVSAKINKIKKIQLNAIT